MSRTSTCKNKVEFGFYSFVKRLLDIIVAFLGIVILFPIFLIISIAIKIDSKGPVIFRQKRFGINQSVFYIYKFRTMDILAPQSVATKDLGDADKYITKLGKILRKTSLDELPQLINILIGQMSIIGPRPVILEEYDLIEEREKYGANSVRPGLTGWAQVNGRDMLDDRTKARYDGEYVDNFGFFMDLKCFFRTIVLVFSKDGVIEGSELVYSKLEGNTIIENISGE